MTKLVETLPRDSNLREPHIMCGLLYQTLPCQPFRVTLLFLSVQ